MLLLVLEMKATKRLQTLPIILAFRVCIMPWHFQTFIISVLKFETSIWS